MSTVLQLPRRIQITLGGGPFRLEHVLNRDSQAPNARLAAAFSGLDRDDGICVHAEYAGSTIRPAQWAEDLLLAVQKHGNT